MNEIFWERQICSALLSVCEAVGFQGSGLVRLLTFKATAALGKGFWNWCKLKSQKLTVLTKSQSFFFIKCFLGCKPLFNFQSSVKADF